MTFVYPQALLLLLAISAFIFAYKNKRVTTIERIFAPEILEKLLLQKGNYLAKNRRFILSIVALILLVLALARPIIVQNQQAKESEVQSFDLVVLLDISRSMQAQDVFPNRLSFAKESFYALQKYISQANIAVIAFANDAFLVSPFSQDFKSINFLVSNLDINSISSKGSDIPTAFEASAKIFNSQKEGNKTLLLMSDGADGGNIDAILERASKDDFTLHVLNIGTLKGASLPDENGGLYKDKNGNIVLSKRDDSIARVAISSGGTFLATSGDMSKIAWLAEQIRKNAYKKESKKNTYEGNIELFYYPLALALALLFFAFNSFGFLTLFVLLFASPKLDARMLDFWTIWQANKSYQNKEYEKAQKEFEKLEQDEASYNSANALYKQGKFSQAAKNYEKIKNFKGQKELQRLYNLGNANAMRGEIDKAIASYEDALKIDSNDADSKFNLELLKKQQQQKEQQKDQNQDQDKNQSNDQEQNKQENQESQQDKKKQENQQSKQDQKEDNQNSTQESQTQDEQKNQNFSESEPKEMSEIEAKKWEKMLQNRAFDTKPYKLQKSIGGEKNENSW